MTPEEIRKFLDTLDHFTTPNAALSVRLVVQTLQDDLQESRATNTRLNRRATRAEVASLVTIERCRREGVSFGRMLANNGLEAVLRERDEARSRLLILAKALDDIAEDLGTDADPESISGAIRRLKDASTQGPSPENVSSGRQGPNPGKVE
jgi:hypothetical protein